MNQFHCRLNQRILPEMNRQTMRKWSCINFTIFFYMVDLASNEDYFIFDEDEQFGIPNNLGRIYSNDSVSLWGGLIKRHSSNDGLLGSIITNKQEQQESNPNNKRKLVLNIGELGTMDEPKVKVFMKRKVRKNKTTQAEYRKNICGYITKKIIREFTNQTFVEKISELCRKYSASMPECRSYYLSKIERVTGPSHIPELLVPACEAEVPMKLVFSQFFEWFLKERYLRYLLTEGKMEQKKAYIKYKNMALLQILRANPCKLASSEPSITTL